MTYIDTVRKRLLENCTVDDITGCWEWTGHRCKDGYGKIGMVVGTKTYTGLLVHRVAAHVFKGFDITSKLYVLHSCDNPPCFNPEHLFYGTQADNVKDCEKKGRRNQAHPKKLNAENVLDIRRLHRSGVAAIMISQQYAISKEMVYAIMRGRVWQHVQ